MGVNWSLGSTTVLYLPTVLQVEAICASYLRTYPGHDVTMSRQETRVFVSKDCSR